MPAEAAVAMTGIIVVGVIVIAITIAASRNTDNEEVVSLAREALSDAKQDNWLKAMGEKFVEQEASKVAGKIQLWQDVLVGELAKNGYLSSNREILELDDEEVPVGEMEFLEYVILDHQVDYFDGMGFTFVELYQHGEDVYLFHVGASFDSDAEPTSEGFHVHSTFGLGTYDEAPLIEADELDDWFTEALSEETQEALEDASKVYHQNFE